MADHQLSESFAECFSQVDVSGGNERADNAQQPENKEDKPGNALSNGLQGEYTQMQLGHQSSASESEWKTTTDTSVHSSPSDGDVPLEVLEACDGLDEMSLSSPCTPPTVVSARGRGRGRGLGRGRGRGYNKRGNNGRKPVQARTKHESESSSSSVSTRSTSSNSDSDSESSSGSSHSSRTTEDSYSIYSSHSSGSSEGSCTDCHSDCSCSCHDYSSSASSTSYESTDDLTDLPRTKRGGRLGHKGTKKVVEHCAQS